MLVRLLVLWLLCEQPLHGYRIKRALDDQGLAFWFPVEYASIYSVLRTLVKEGHAEEAGAEQHGARPERRVYRITVSGRAHYRGLVEKALATPDPAGGPLSLALAAIDDLDPPRASAALRMRRDALRARITRCETLRRAAPDAAMADRTRVMAEADLAWLDAYLRGRGLSLDGEP